jgi:hypothetical protein
MSRRRVRGALLCVLVGATTTGSPGCAAWCVEGDTIMTHRKGDAPEPREAPSDGEYALHNMYWNLRPIRSRNLWRGDPLGFRREGEDKVVAIAGDREYVLNDGNYVWKRK